MACRLCPTDPSTSSGWSIGAPSVPNGPQYPMCAQVRRARYVSQDLLRSTRMLLVLAQQQASPLSQVCTDRTDTLHRQVLPDLVLVFIAPVGRVHGAVSLLRVHIHAHEHLLVHLRHELLLLLR